MEKSSPYIRGRRYEYKLMSILKKNGFFVMRSPASGRKSVRYYYPDIVAIKQGRIIIFEVKMIGDKRALYLPRRQYRKLEWIRRVTGAECYISVYYKDKGKFLFVDLNSYERKSNRYYIWSRRYITEKGKTLSEVVGEC